MLRIAGSRHQGRHRYVASVPTPKGTPEIIQRANGEISEALKPSDIAKPIEARPYARAAFTSAEFRDLTVRHSFSKFSAFLPSTASSSARLAKTPPLD
jgi:hypothetical protein